MTTEHFKNHPKDKKLNSWERKMMSANGKLKDKIRLSNVHREISIQLLKTQIESDQQIKTMFIEKFPNEYRIALMASIDRYGATKKREVRRDEIIKSLNLKDPNIVKKIFKGWSPDDTAV